jgi:hypothetical protein
VFFERCGSLIFKDNREQNIGVRRSLTLQWPDSIQNGILRFLSDINEVHKSRVLCARRSSVLNFMRETNHEKNALPEVFWNWEGLGPRRFRWLPSEILSLLKNLGRYILYLIYDNLGFETLVWRSGTRPVISHQCSR